MTMQLVHSNQAEIEEALAGFDEAHQEFLDLDCRKLFAAKKAGDWLRKLQALKPELDSVRNVTRYLVIKGRRVGKTTIGTYLRVSTQWNPICAALGDKLNTTGYVRALRVLSKPATQTAEPEGWVEDPPGTHKKGKVTIQFDAEEKAYEVFGVGGTTFTLSSDLKTAKENGEALLKGIEKEERLGATEVSHPASPNDPNAPPLDWKGERIRNVPPEKDAKIEGYNSPPEEEGDGWETNDATYESGKATVEWTQEDDKNWTLEIPDACLFRIQHCTELKRPAKYQLKRKKKGESWEGIGHYKTLEEAQQAGNDLWETTCENAVTFEDGWTQLKGGNGEWRKGNVKVFFYPRKRLKYELLTLGGKRLGWYKTLQGAKEAGDKCLKEKTYETLTFHDCTDLAAPDYHTLTFKDGTGREITAEFTGEIRVFISKKVSK